MMQCWTGAGDRCSNCTPRGAVTYPGTAADYLDRHRRGGVSCSRCLWVACEDSGLTLKELFATLTLGDNVKKEAAGVLVTREDGKILGFRRAGLKPGIAFPGGKAEPGESLAETAVRETFEETGHVVVCQHAYRAEVRPGVKFTVFWARTVAKVDRVTTEGAAEWVTVQDLLDGPFGAYNEACLRHFGLLLRGGNQ